MVDACALAGALQRNLLLSLAEAEFFRVRWSAQVLDEAERAIAKIMTAKGDPAPLARARKSRAAMELAFEDATVGDYETIQRTLSDLPDPNDAHVIAAAVKTKASIIVTENVKHFPEAVIAPLELEAKTVDEFVADTIDLYPGRAVAAIRTMRLRLKKPEKSAEALLLDMEAAGLLLTADALRTHVLSL